MNQERKESAKVTGESSSKAQEKAKARKERNEAQAIEESQAWNVIRAKAQHAATMSKPRIKYSEALADEICTRLSCGESLNHMTTTLDHMPSIAAIYDWLEKYPSFASNYTRARENAATTLFSMAKDAAEDDSKDVTPSGEVNHAAIARSKLKVDTYLRMAGKLSIKYSERTNHEPAQVTVNHNTLNVSARDLSLEQRDSLRQLLLAAKRDDS